MNYIQNMQLCMQPCILTTVYININIFGKNIWRFIRPCRYWQIIIGSLPVKIIIIFIATATKMEP